MADLTVVDGQSTEKQFDYVCRIGTIYLAVPNDSGPEDRLKAIAGALENDSRVISISTGNQNPAYMHHRQFFPAWDTRDPEAVITGSDVFTALQFHLPITFKVVVPVKNQPKHHNADDIPTDTYWMAWDGMVATVLWKHPGGEIPRSGGQVILEILEKAAGEIGCSVYNQACSPGCENVFMHADMALRKTAGVEAAHVTSSHHSTVFVDIASSEDDRESLRSIVSNLTISCRHFSEQKNIGRRVLDLEIASWAQLSHLLGHYTEHVKISTLPFLKSLKRRWNNRGWRSEVRTLSAQIWLCLTAMEVLLRNWRDDRRNFDEQAAEAGIEPIFKIDYRDDVEMIESINLARLESIASQVESRLDSRLISWATAGGAVAGATAGALVSLLH